MFFYLISFIVIEYFVFLKWVAWHKIEVIRELQFLSKIKCCFQFVYRGSGGQLPTYPKSEYLGMTWVNLNFVHTEIVIVFLDSGPVNPQCN